MNGKPAIAVAIAIGVVFVAVMIGIFGRKPGRETDAQVAHRKPVAASHADAGSVTATPSSPRVGATSQSRSTTAVAGVTRQPRRGVYDPQAKPKPVTQQTDWVCIPGSGVGLWPKKATS